MGLTLFLVTLIAGVSLGFVFEVTKEPIAQAKLAKKLRAIDAVMPSYDNDPLSSVKMFTIVGGKDSIECYVGKKGNDVVGYAVKSKSAKGYSGDVWIMTGFDGEGGIVNTYVLEHKETPGLGSKMADEKFKEQFLELVPGKKPLAVNKDGGEIDAISGATISSRAFCEAVNSAAEILSE